MPSLDNVFTNCGAAAPADPGKRVNRVNNGADPGHPQQSGKRVSNRSAADLGQSGKRAGGKTVVDPLPPRKRVNTGSLEDAMRSGKPLSSHDDVDATSLPPPPPELRGELPVVPQRHSSLLASLASSGPSPFVTENSPPFPPFPPPPPPLSSQEINALSFQSLPRQPCAPPPYPKKHSGRKTLSGPCSGQSRSGVRSTKDRCVATPKTDSAACFLAGGLPLHPAGGKGANSHQQAPGRELPGRELPGRELACSHPSAACSRDNDLYASSFKRSSTSPRTKDSISTWAGCPPVAKKPPLPGTQSTLYVNGEDSTHILTGDVERIAGRNAKSPPPYPGVVRSQFPIPERDGSGSERKTDSPVDTTQQSFARTDCDAYVNQNHVYPACGGSDGGSSRPQCQDPPYINKDSVACPPSKAAVNSGGAKKSTCSRDTSRVDIRRELEACLTKKPGNTAGRRPAVPQARGSSSSSASVPPIPGNTVGKGGPLTSMSNAGTNVPSAPYINGEESASLCRSVGAQAAGLPPDPHTDCAAYLNAEETSQLSCGEGEANYPPPPVTDDYTQYMNKDTAAYFNNMQNAGCEANADRAKCETPATSAQDDGPKETCEDSFTYVNNNQDASAACLNNTAESCIAVNNNEEASATYFNDTTQMCEHLNNQHNASASSPNNIEEHSTYINNDQDASATYLNNAADAFAFSNITSAETCTTYINKNSEEEPCCAYLNEATEACAAYQNNTPNDARAVTECQMDGKDWEGSRTPCTDPAMCGGPGSGPGGLHTEQQRLLDGMGSPATCCGKHGAFSSEAMGVSGRPLNRQRSTFSTRSTSSRRRQNDSPCTTCLRGTLHCYNVCILIIGCAVLGVGVWLLVTDFGARNVTTIVGNQMYEVTTYLLIAGGGAVALLAFCGCCGTIRDDKCVLSFYGTTLAIVLIVLGVACGLAVFFKGTISEHIKERMKNSLTMHYGVDIRTNLENRRATEAWDALQRQLQCCGISGNTTSRDSWNYYSSSTEWNIREQKKAETKRVPESCCAKGDMQLCTGLKPFNGPPMFFDNHLAKYREVNPYLYTTGCYDKLIEYLHTYSAIVSIVAAVVPLFLILGIVVSFCLCSRVAGISADDEMDV